MEKHTTQCPVASSPTWEHLETALRGRMREWLQELLDAEVDELLGRRKSARRKPVDSAPGYRSGHGKPWRLTVSCGTVTVRRPRVRGLEQRFKSRLLPLFARRTPEANALRGLLGEDAPLSAATVSRLKEQWHAEQAQWASRPLADLEVVYLWVDGVYVKAGLEREKAAVLVVLAALRDGRKELVALVPGHLESTEGWSAVLRDVNARGRVAQQQFRRLHAPELMKEVYHGAEYVNGVRVHERPWEVAAAIQLQLSRVPPCGPPEPGMPARRHHH